MIYIIREVTKNEYVQCINIRARFATLTFEPRSDRRDPLATNFNSEIFTEKEAIVNNYRKSKRLSLQITKI